MSLAPRAQAFFLPGAEGERFCLHHPAHGQTCAALVYIHPFGEEMNCARRMAASTARALAARGVAVLQIDLAGCGDSAGRLEQASWDQWLGDIGRAVAWLQQSSGCAPGLWGLRLGALLALAYAAADAPVARLLLWQPVLDGDRYLDQLLRLHLASELVHGAAPGQTGTQLRAALARGDTLDVGGYPLTPALADAMRACQAGLPTCPVDVLEVTRQPALPVSVPVLRAADAWRQQNLLVRVQQVQGAPFWSDISAAIQDQVVAATVALMEDREDRHA